MDASKSKVLGEIGEGDEEGVILSTFRLRQKKARLALNRRKSKMVSCSCHLKYCKNNRASQKSTAGNDDEDDQELIISSIPFPCHAVFIFLDPILLGVVQAEYQNKPKTPSEAHPIQMCAFITAICIYSVVLGIKHYVQSPSRSAYLDQILSCVLLLSGSLSSASLLSVLLSRLLVWFLVIIWGSIPFIMAHQLLKISLPRLSERMMKWTWKVWDCVVNIPLGGVIRQIQSQQHLPK